MNDARRSIASGRSRAPKPIGAVDQSIRQSINQANKQSNKQPTRLSSNQSNNQSNKRSPEPANQLQKRTSQPSSGHFSPPINQTTNQSNNPDWSWINTDIPPEYRAPIGSSIDQSTNLSFSHYTQSPWRECGFELEKDRYFVTSFVAFHAARSVHQANIRPNQSLNAKLLTQAEEWSRLTSGMSQFEPQVEAASVNQFEKQIKMTHSWATQC